MKIFKNKKKLLKEISLIKDIAFVPTMGSIHKGHLSLIKKAKINSKNVVVSIYVNPKQFNLNSDYKKYPRSINKDIAILKKFKVRYLYLPTYKDLYSFKPKSSIYLDKFSKKLCGSFKTSHFKGVINVVNRFIEIINPRTIFLGLKDFQQLILIKSHINKNKILTKIISCTTIREKNGTALSSRNNQLNKNELKITTTIYNYLKDNKSEIISNILKKKHTKIINKILLLGAKKIDYLECINLQTLKNIKKNNEKSNIFISYWMGNVRLIDNL